MSELKITSAAAYVSALQEMENAPFDKVNPHFKSRYATYNSVREITNRTLILYQLAICENIVYREGNSFLRSEVRHISGDVVNFSEYRLKDDTTDQQRGSALTYARRYNRSMLCGISSEEDDDGNEASAAPQKREKLKGPLQITALKTQLNNCWRELDKCESLEEFEQVKLDYAAVLSQCKEEARELLIGTGDGISFNAFYSKKLLVLTEIQKQIDQDDIFPADR